MNITLDLRDRLLPIRDQGYRPTCVAFAASDAHSFRQESEEWLSAEYLFYFAKNKCPGTAGDEGISLIHAGATITADGQPYEMECPYLANGLDSAPRLSPGTSLFNWRTEVKLYQPVELYELALDERIFVLGLYITREFQTVGSPFVVDDDGTDSIGRHAVVLAGLADDYYGQKLFLVKNSWGTDWADGGYAWLTSDYLSSNLFSTLELLKAG